MIGHLLTQIWWSGKDAKLNVASNSDDEDEIKFWHEPLLDLNDDTEDEEYNPSDLDWSTDDEDEEQDPCPTPEEDLARQVDFQPSRSYGMDSHEVQNHICLPCRKTKETQDNGVVTRSRYARMPAKKLSNYATMRGSCCRCKKTVQSPYSSLHNHFAKRTGRKSIQILCKDCARRNYCVLCFTKIH